MNERTPQPTLRHRGTSSRLMLDVLKMWGFLKIRGTILGVLILRIIVYWGLYWGSPYFGKLPCGGPSQNSSVGYLREYHKLHFFDAGRIAWHAAWAQLCKRCAALSTARSRRNFNSQLSWHRSRAALPSLTCFWTMRSVVRTSGTDEHAANLLAPRTNFKRCFGKDWKNAGNTKLC